MNTEFWIFYLVGFNGSSESFVSTLLLSFERKSLITDALCKYSGLLITAA
jgi:hypothetical protein